MVILFVTLAIVLAVAGDRPLRSANAEREPRATFLKQMIAAKRSRWWTARSRTRPVRPRRIADGTYVRVGAISGDAPKNSSLEHCVIFKRLRKQRT
jgi:hypothetical protein